MRFVRGFVLSCLVALLAPAAAQAHGLTVRADLPLPAWLFAWAAAVVLVLSFVALAVLWRQPLLERDRFRPFPSRASRILTSRTVEIVCGAIGVGLLVVTIWAGFAGSSIVSFNFAPTFIYVVFWLGLVLASVLFGDVFRAFNPWRAIGRVVGAAVRRLGTGEALPYPAWLGRWPAALGLLAFTALEIVAIDGQRPSGIASAAVAYSAVTWLGMMLFGVERWTERGEAFSVYFNLVARMAPLERRGDTIGLRLPLSGLTRVEPLPGTVAVVLVMIAGVSFDGASGGPAWQSVVPSLQDVYAGGLGPFAPIELTFATGLLAAVAIVSALLWLGVAGASSVARRQRAVDLARAFAPSLVPIAFAYAGAHYVSLLVLQGQAIVPLASDPLGHGWNLFGTADWKVNYGLIGANTFWYLQVVLVVLGHAAALAVAHDRALVLFPDRREAARSQYWMLAVMVIFTVVALWLLNQANEG